MPRGLNMKAFLLIQNGNQENNIASNITLKRDAPYRGGFGGLLFFQLRWLR